MWYSFDWGNVHVIMMDSEHDWQVGSNQHSWLEADLAAVDRLVFVGSFLKFLSNICYHFFSQKSFLTDNWKKKLFWTNEKIHFCFNCSNLEKIVEKISETNWCTHLLEFNFFSLFIEIIKPKRLLSSENKTKSILSNSCYPKVAFKVKWLIF